MTPDMRALQAGLSANLTNVAWFVTCAFLLAFATAAGLNFICRLAPRPIRAGVAMFVLIFLFIVLVTSGKF